jgi:hypothetical protein
MSLNAVDKSIIHWTRMIKWVEKQPPEDKIDSEKMKREIGESWYMEDCFLCETYYDCNTLSCDACPLQRKYGICGNPEAKNRWKGVDKAKKWSEWLEEAKVMLRQLESLTIQIQNN